MELLFILAAICLLIYIVGVAVKFLKRHGMTVLRWIVAILAVVIGIKLLPLLGTTGTVIITCAGIVCFVALLAFALYYLIGYGSYPRWLERVGIGLMKDAPGQQSAHEQALERGYAEMLGSEYSANEQYVLSIRFREKILRNADQSRFLTKEKFCKCCRKAAPKFRTEYAGILLSYLCNEDYLLKLGAEGPYLSQKMVLDCEHILDKEGAATEDEFAEICGKSDAASCLYVERNLLATAILANMVRTGKADKVTPNGSGLGLGDLYVSKNPAKNCRMTKREISLDD